MLIQITNTCHMLCPHCMQRSDATPRHMSMETVELCARHAEELGVMAVMISGGEPTEHPQFKEIVKRFLKFPVVGIISNGDWADNLEMIKTMRWLLSHRNVSLQITNIPGIYPREVNIRKIRTLFPRLTPTPSGTWRCVASSAIRSSTGRVVCTGQSPANAHRSPTSANLWRT